MKTWPFIEKLLQIYPQNLVSFLKIGGREEGRLINFFKNFLKIIKLILVRILITL